MNTEIEVIDLNEPLVKEDVVITAYVSVEVNGEALCGKSIITAKMSIPESLCKDRLATLTPYQKNLRELALSTAKQHAKQQMIENLVTRHKCERESIEFIKELTLESL